MGDRSSMPELMPLVCRDLDVCAFKLLAPALDHPVEANVVLKRVGTHDVVVVAIAEPYGDAAGLIDLPGDGLGTNGDVHVACRLCLVDCKWKPVIGRLRAGLLDGTSAR